MVFGLTFRLLYKKFDILLGGSVSVQAGVSGAIPHWGKKKTGQAPDRGDCPGSSPDYL
jgi:hypothetical protein